MLLEFLFVLFKFPNITLETSFNDFLHVSSIVVNFFSPTFSSGLRCPREVLICSPIEKLKIKVLVLTQIYMFDAYHSRSELFIGGIV